MNESMQTNSKAGRAAELVSNLKAKVGRKISSVVTNAAMHPEPLPPAIQAERKVMRVRRGQALSYYEDRRAHGRPLVLLHSINACSSAFEMKPLFERYRSTRPVFAPDLPGFGFSERDAREYTADLYADELVDFLTRVKDKGDAPDVVALSLSCELVARAATARKDLVHSLAFLSPTGFERAADKGPASTLRSIAAKASGSIANRWWSPLAFGAIASRPSVHYFLGKSFVGPVDAELQTYAYATSHQPGAEHAPLAFLSGKLSTPNVKELYASLERPTLVLYDRDGYTSFDGLPEMVDQQAMWESTRISPTRGMPHFERLDETAAALEAFWSAHSHTHHS